MLLYRLTRKAEDDLKQIYLYSYEHFGHAQAGIHAHDILTCFQLLAERPRIGHVRPGKPDALRVFAHKNHVIAYRLIDAGILIQRILDVRRDWQRIFGLK